MGVTSLLFASKYLTLKFVIFLANTKSAGQADVALLAGHVVFNLLLFTPVAASVLLYKMLFLTK